MSPRPGKPKATLEAILAELHDLANVDNVAGMARFGISTTNTLGISIATLRGIARRIARDHDLAMQLWATGIHEARMLATLVDEPAKVTEQQMDAWVADLDSWDLCDGCCMNLFTQTPFARAKVVEWADRDETFVKRAAFALIAALSHVRATSDDEVRAFLPLIERVADDDRNFVKKAVNWALRDIGKRNLALNLEAIACAERIQATDGRAARWIAADALRELRGAAVQKKLGA